MLATGEPHSLGEFVDAAFAAVGLEARAHVDLNPSLARKADIENSAGNPSRAKERLGWEARVRMTEVARRMVDAERARSDPRGPRSTPR